MTDNEAVVHIHNNVGTKKGEIMLVSATWTQLENMMHFLTFFGGCLSQMYLGLTLGSLFGVNLSGA